MNIVLAPPQIALPWRSKAIYETHAGYLTRFQSVRDLRTMS
jgi:hypothetical protein